MHLRYFHVLSILNLDWQQHARSVHRVYEWIFMHSAYITGMLQPIWLDITQNTRK